MKCNKCNLEIPDNSKFCLHCGAKVEVVNGNICPKCGYKNPLDARFCTECGRSIAGTRYNAISGGIPQSIEKLNNTLDINKYNFLLFRGVQIYGTIANVEEKLCSLGYKKENGLFVGSYAGYDNCTIEIRITGATKHVNELLIMLSPPYDVDKAKQKFIEAIRTKYKIDGREVKKGITFDIPNGTINIHRDNTGHITRLKIRLRGLDGEYKQYDADKNKLEHDKNMASVIDAI